MAGYVQAAPVQEQTGEAQIVRLTPAAAKQLLASRIERSGTEITGMTLAVPADQGTWLRARLPDSAFQAFRQKLAALPHAERAAFSSLWLERVEEALYGEYRRVTSADPQQSFFSYPLPPLEVQAAATATGAARQFLPSVPKKTAAEPGTLSRAKTPRAAAGAQTRFQTEELKLPPLPKGVTGKGTPEDPYLIDIYLKGDIPGLGAFQLILPVFFDVSETAVRCRYCISAVQLKEIESRPNGPLVKQLQAMTRGALERFCAENKVPYSGEVYRQAKADLEELGDDLVQNIAKIKDPELKKYFGR